MRSLVERGRIGGCARPSARTVALVYAAIPSAISLSGPTPAAFTGTTLK